MLHILLLVMLLAGGSMPSNNMQFTASTPANSSVKTFLGIEQADSIDFIRWKLTISDLKEFQLSCSYGISKANTNGFVNEQNVQLSGSVTMEDKVLTLASGGRRLQMLLINENIVHLLDSNDGLMVGNGGWSYTLNALQPSTAKGIMMNTKSVNFSDSIILDGRTPCRGIEELTENRTRAECYKKKWRISLYKHSSGAVSGSYKIGTVAARTGKWKLKDNLAGRPVYSLDLNNGNTLDLLQVDENIVYIMDRNGGLMVGDHDFSYSLNRKGFTTQ